METLPSLFERTPFDLLFKNFFQDDDLFHPVTTSKISHPVDIYETDTGIVFDIACTGIPKEEIKITTQNNILRITYDKVEKEEKNKYTYKGIARRSFNLGWKIADCFDLSKGEARFKDGLLSVMIPFTEKKESEIGVIEIQ